VKFEPASHYQGDEDFYEALDLEEGDYVAELYGGKSGVQKISVRYNLTVDAVVGSANIDVKPGAFEKIVVNDGKEVKIKVNTVSGPYKLALADKFGNQTTATTRQHISWSVKDSDGDLAGSNVGVRLSSGGANVSEISTMSVQNIYLDVNKVGVYTMEFTTEGYSGTLEVEVVK
jgi:hypothetical protein